MPKNTATLDLETADLRLIQDKLARAKIIASLCTATIIASSLAVMPLYIGIFSSVGTLAIHLIFSIEASTTYPMMLAGSCFFVVYSIIAFHALAKAQKWLEKTTSAGHAHRGEQSELIQEMNYALQARSGELAALDLADEIGADVRVTHAASRPPRI